MKKIQSITILRLVYGTWLFLSRWLIRQNKEITLIDPFDKCLIYYISKYNGGIKSDKNP